MELKHHDAVLARRDSFVIDPRLLKVDDGYNVRDLTTPETREHIDGLKESIGANGVRVALEVRLAGEDIYIVAGHCRHVAVMELIAEGRDDIKGVPCVQMPKINDAERTLNLVISNSGKPLTTLEVAEVVRRLEAFGWTEAEIQKRMRWKSRATVTQHAEVAALPEGMKQHIRAGDISPTTARNIAKGVDPVEAEKMFKANLEENKRLGVGKKNPRTKVTAKTIKRDAQPKLQSPTATPEQIAEVLGDPAAAEELPDWDDLRGRAPDATGNLSSEAFVREQRSAWPDRQAAGIPIKITSPEPDDLPSGLPATQNQIQYDDTFAALYALTLAADKTLQHNQSDDNPGYWSAELVGAIDDAIAIIEKLTGKPFERETIADSMSQEVVTEDAA